MTTMSSVYITCQVLPGLFDNEYYVMVNGSSAYYINRKNVKVEQEPTPESAVNGQVFGYFVEAGTDKILVQLTGEAALGGLRTWVESEAVVAA